MAMIRFLTVSFVTSLILAGCASSGGLFDRSSSADPGAKGKSAQQAKSVSRAASQARPPAVASAKSKAGTAMAAAPPRLGGGKIIAASASGSRPTGTFVGEKVQQLRAELERLKQSVGRQDARLNQLRGQTTVSSSRYHMAIATINTRLQVGTTPGNPVLVNHWNNAQSELARIDADVAELNSLANSVAGTSTMSSYLLETTRAAYGLTGAVDEDHRQLSEMEDEVSRTVVLIDRILNQLSEDIGRQINYVANERSNLTTLSLAIKNGELLGANLRNRAFLAAANQQAMTAMPARARIPVTSSPLPPPRPARVETKSAKAGTTASPRKTARATKKRRPLVVIRFDRPNVSFEQALYSAVSRALERRPAAMFDLVAVASGDGSVAKVAIASTTSKRNAEVVLRSLSEMGLPLERIRLSAMTSKGAPSNEVHIYVR